MDNNRHICQWEDYMNKAKESLENKNFEEYKDLLKKACDTVDLYKNDCELTYECVNFGMSNYIFEDALPKLFKTNKNAVKEFITTIKEDNNLKKQFQFYKALESYNSNMDCRDYINESLKLVIGSIDKKSISESNEKLNRIIKKYNIKPSTVISEDKLKFFNNCDFLFKNEKKLTNLANITENIDGVVNYVTNNVHSINETKTNTFDLIENFDSKYSSLLNEEEKDFVKEIISCKSKNNVEKKEKLFNGLKNECLNIIDKLIGESNDDDKVGLEAIKEQIDSKMFCEDTLVSDIANLLEIRDVLKS